MITFEKLEEAHLEQVLQWRTSEHVTKHMYTDIEYKLDNQKKWFKGISEDPTQYHWIIKCKDVNIGLVSLNQWDKRNHRASSGFYIGDLNYAMIAGRILPYLYNFAFFELGLHKLAAEVLEGNEGVMKMHLHHGYSQEAIFKDHIYKYNRYHNVHYFELLAETWKEKNKKFHQLTAQFSL